jgi:hypothetical protein
MITSKRLVRGWKIKQCGKFSYIYKFSSEYFNVSLLYNKILTKGGGSVSGSMAPV